MKYSFLNDYSEGCHQKILAALSEHNATQEFGYGQDDVCSQATALFQQMTNQPTAQLHYVTGGTQANLVCLAAILKPFEAIISASTGHIAVNEAGAIEATGHKIISMPAENGKLTVVNIEVALKKFTNFPHVVRPKVVYITNATEVGTVYSKAELMAISACCKQHDLYLFMDGARLSQALASPVNDMTLMDIAELTDIFWFGGTKNGALIGEAIIITNDDLKADFSFHLKQRGALLAKGRLIGTQFTTLLTDDLYLELAAHANSMALKLSNGIIKAGYELVSATESNQVFAVLPHQLIARLQENFIFYEWETRENDSVVRLVTSWATDINKVEVFIDTVHNS